MGVKPPAPLRIAMIVADEREVLAQYSAPEPWFGPAPTALLAGLAELPEVEIHIVTCVRKPVAMPEKTAPNTFYHAVRVPSWGYLKSLYIPAIHRIRKRLRAIQPDVVHGQGTERYYALAAAFSGRPSLVTIHGNMRAVAHRLGAPRFSFHGITAALEAIALRRAGGVCCNSAYTESQVADLARRTWRVPNALNPLFFKNPPAPRDAVPRLINVGHILPYKNQLELLAVAERLHARGHRFHLEFVGGAGAGGYADRFRAAVDAAARTGFASWSGRLDTAATIARLDAAAALVHVSSEESFGLAVAEALARNLRVFAFSAGGVADVIAGFPAATAFKSGDWPSLEAALESWLLSGSPAAPESAPIAARYSPATIARAQLAAYRELLGATCPEPPQPVSN
jgi:glycosyltransferase involved in cell wall biosynthesis